jgi:Protein of unknown function (DUF2721)
VYEPGCVFLHFLGADHYAQSRRDRPFFMDLQSNPFAALSLIVAPAILTNASSVLAMSTSNRLARAVDRARNLSRQLEGTAPREPPHDEQDRDVQRRLDELAATEQRAVMLLQVLRSFYLALGGFASATLFSLLGAVVATVGRGPIISALEVTAVAGGTSPLARSFEDLRC